MILDFYSRAIEGVLEIWIQIVPVVFPLILLLLLYHFWRAYIGIVYLSKVSRVLLEVRLPREIFKSPRSMEIVIGALYQTYEGNWYSRLTRGISRTWFSLELVSIEGQVHFFIWTDKLFKNIIEAQIYAQYPGVEIYEVPDYTHTIHYDHGHTVEMWGQEVVLDKPDPYPIKSYVDFGLDQESVKEEMKTDPLSAVIEYLGSLGRGENAWIQICVMATKNQRRKHGTLFGKQGWKDEGKELVEKLMKRNSSAKAHGAGPDAFVDFSKITLSPGEREVVEAVERNISKPGFDTGIRMIYIAKKENYQLSNQLGLRHVLKAFNTLHLNSFKNVHDTSFDYPWQDFRNIRLNHHKKLILDHFRARSFFYHPYAVHPYVLNTEELATIYHFPGGVVTTPLVARIPSKKSEPPPNLPI